MSKKKTPQSSKSKTFPIGRNAKTGELTTVEVARRHPSTHIVERMPKSGHGDTKGRPRPPRLKKR